MKLLSASSAIRMVLEGRVGVLRPLHSSGNLRGCIFCPLCSVECVSAVVSWLSSFFSASVLLVDSSGRTKVNVVPLPTSEVTDMFATQTFDDGFADESPNPVPWAKLFTLTETFEYPVHLVRCNAHTRIGDVECYILAFLAIPVTDTATVVNLKALPIRLEMTWKIRFLSPSITIFSSEVRISVPLLWDNGNMCVVYLLAEWMEAYGRDGELHDADSILISRGDFVNELEQAFVVRFHYFVIALLSSSSVLSAIFVRSLQWH